MMKRLLLPVVAAMLSLGACDSASAPLEPVAEPTSAPPSFASGDVWTLFTNQVPNETLTFTGDGWEVGTQFYLTRPACVAYLRFWRAAGETGTNRIKIWRAGTGAQIASRTVPTSGTGWQTVYFSGVLCLDAYVNYRVSVNTNTAQVKTFGAFSNGPIVNGIMVATDGYYGQPIDSMPTTNSPSNFFVDLVVVES